MNQQVRRSRWIGLLCALILLAGLIGPLQASRGTLVRAASPELKFTPSKAKAGESVKATGKRLPEDVAGELIWERDGSILATFETDGSGRFKASFVVPQAAGGDYEVAAKIKDESGKVKTEATEELTVLDPPTATAGRRDVRRRWRSDCAAWQAPCCHARRQAGCGCHQCREYGAVHHRVPGESRSPPPVAGRSVEPRSSESSRRTNGTGARFSPIRPRAVDRGHAAV